mgnify:CR=1 FL=1
MIVHVDVSSRTVSLSDPYDFNAFHVAAAHTASAGDIVAVLAEDGAEADPDHVFVAVDALRRWSGRSGDPWEKGFTAMCEYAEREGWTSPDGAMIRAHLERTGRGSAPA